MYTCNITLGQTALSFVHSSGWLNSLEVQVIPALTTKHGKADETSGRADQTRITAATGLYCIMIDGDLSGVADCLAAKGWGQVSEIAHMHFESLDASIA